MHWQQYSPRDITSLTLHSGEVHLWAWDFSRQPDLAKDKLTLSREESYQLKSLKFEADQVRYLISHSNLQRILSGYLGFIEKPLQFELGSHGKPSLRYPHSSVRFNLSHSSKLGLLAVSNSLEVGVDVEDIHPVEPGLCKAFFSAAEQSEMAALSGDRWLESFFRCWTRKEAILKAEGTGLNVRLDSFDVSLSAEAPADLLASRPAAKLSRTWRLIHLDPAPGVVAALASSETATVRCFRLVETADASVLQLSGIHEGLD